MLRKKHLLAERNSIKHFIFELAKKQALLILELVREQALLTHYSFVALKISSMVVVPFTTFFNPFSNIVVIPFSTAIL